MSKIAHASSIVFRAACNEAVDASIRPIRQRVVYRLAQRCKVDDCVNKLISNTWHQAEEGVLQQPRSSWREKLLENKFVELIAGDPQWKTLVLEAVIQERRWSDIWSHGFNAFVDRCASLAEKVSSPDHPSARVTTSTLSSLAAILVALWIPQKLHPGIYDLVLSPVIQPFKSPPLTLDPKVGGSAQVDLHVNAILDDKPLNFSITPHISPSAVNMALHPSLDAPVRFLPQIQYPSLDLANSAPPATKPQGLAIRLTPEIGSLNLPGGLWDSKTGSFRVSVTQLEGPTQNGATQAIPIKDSQDPTQPSRPLDKIQADLEELRDNFQVSKSDSQSGIAILQQNQNAIHSIAANHGRTIAIDATPNSLRSVVLQWAGPDNKPRSCTLTLNIKDIGATEVKLEVTNEACSLGSALVASLPAGFQVGPDKPGVLEPWIISVDETRRYRIFQHAATLRFTWQPGIQTVTAEKQP